MKKKVRELPKCTLEDLKIKSFITSLEGEKIRGGGDPWSAVQCPDTVQQDCSDGLGCGPMNQI